VDSVTVIGGIDYPILFSNPWDDSSCIVPGVKTKNLFLNIRTLSS